MTKIYYKRDNAVAGGLIYTFIKFKVKKDFTKIKKILKLKVGNKNEKIIYRRSPT